MAIEIRPVKSEEFRQLGDLTSYAYAGQFGDGPENTVTASNRPERSLWAPQAAIYQRYGYSMVTVMRNYQVDITDIDFHDGDDGSSEVERRRQS